MRTITDYHNDLRMTLIFTIMEIETEDRTLHNDLRTIVTMHKIWAESTPLILDRMIHH